MNITTGRIATAIKCCLYGPEGIGKSTFASQFPHAIFIDTEGGTSQMDVARAPNPRSWSELMQHVDYFIQHSDQLGTLVIDTLDAAERLCIDQFCASKKLDGIEGMPYGRGYVYIAEEFGRLLNKLEQLRSQGVHIVLTAHAQLKKFEQPDEMGQYDRWELKLGKKTAPLVKEWVDMLLMANYKTIVVNVDGQGATKGKNKATGGKRIMYTTHHPCWDAKNRFGLPDELPFDYGQIAHLVANPAPSQANASNTQVHDLMPAPAPASQPQQPAPPVQQTGDIPPALAALMAANNVKAAEIQYAVAQRYPGVFPTDMPIGDYPADFVRGVLIAAWPQVEAAVLANRQKPTPF